MFRVIHVIIDQKLKEYMYALTQFMPNKTQYDIFIMTGEATLKNSGYKVLGRG